MSVKDHRNRQEKTDGIQKQMKNTEEWQTVSPERADEWQVAQARESFPETPERFRQMVRQAVAMEIEKSGDAKAEQVHKMRRKKKGVYKVLFPLAATLVLGGAVLAAGGTWLYRQMTEQGFTPEEAEMLLVTEPQQQATELTVTELPEGTLKEKNWEEPILTITEAYFDGSSLHFLAQASEEAKNYTLALKDHAYVNQLDGMTALWEVDEDGLYLGEIILREEGAGAQIMTSDTAEVVMRVMAYPKYDGRIFYAWKDVEVYEEIFGTGAFKNEQLGTCYALSYEDAMTGYTPYKITMEVPLSEEARAVIEKYQSQVKDTEGSGFDMSTEADDSGAIAQWNIENTADSGQDPDAADTLQEGVQRIKASEQNFLENAVITDTHVTCTLSGQEMDLVIDADITGLISEVYTGTLQASAMDLTKLMELYTAGDAQNWEAEDISDEYAAERSGEEFLEESEAAGMQQYESWHYGDSRIYVSSDWGTVHYQNDDLASAELTEGLSRAEEGMEKEFCGNLLKGLGQESIVTENEFFSGEEVKYFRAQRLLEGLPVAWFSQWESMTSVVLENGYLALLTMPGGLEVLEKEQAELADMETILEKAAGYVAAGAISMVEGDQPVDEISLEYYVDLTKQGLIFRPIWNFKVPAIWDGMEGSEAAKNYFYIDALTGALIRDCYGYKIW